jgi:hypothetical protein
MTDKSMNTEIPGNAEIWQRGGFILVFALISGISKIIIWSLVLFQFVYLLIARQTNPQLARFSQSLSVFVYQLLQYVMFNSEEKPFPFSAWPEPRAMLTKEETVSSQSRKKTAKKAARKKKVVTSKKE